MDDVTKLVIAKLDKLETKIDKVHNKVSSIEKDVAVNTSDLKDHMRRTSALEKLVNSIPKKLLVWVSLLSGILALVVKFKSS